MNAKEKNKDLKKWILILGIAISIAVALSLYFILKGLFCKNDTNSEICGIMVPCVSSVFGLFCIGLTIVCYALFPKKKINSNQKKDTSTLKKLGIALLLTVIFYLVISGVFINNSYGGVISEILTVVFFITTTLILFLKGEVKNKK